MSTQQTKQKKSTDEIRQFFLEKMSNKFPDRKIETDEDFLEVLHDYDCELCNTYDRMQNGHSRLQELFTRDPKIGQLITEVIEGEDPMIACVRNLGMDCLSAAHDHSRTEDFRRANQEYLNRNLQFRMLQQQQEKNWQLSQRNIARFTAEHGLSPADFEDFQKQIIRLAEHIFMADFSDSILEMLYKAFNYEKDLNEARKMGQIKGKNERIYMERRDLQSRNYHNEE